jgi:hypothetical protein
MANLDTLYLIQKNSNGTKIEVPASTANFLVGASGSVNFGSASTVGLASWGGPGGSILGGYGHSVNGGYSSIVQGYFNKVSAYAGTIAGGSSNIISGNSDRSTIGGGNDNKILESSNSAVIGGGSNNQIRKSSNSAVAGGMNNMISGENGGLNQDFNFIGGGCGNILKNKNGWSLIVGGRSNTIYGSTNNEAFYNTIVGGWDNSIVDTLNDAGSGPILTSTILGGQSNRITGRGSYSQILGGYNNKLSTDYSVILGGICNEINDCLGAFGSHSDFNLIYGSCNKTCGGRSNAILGGSQNIASNGSFIAGGNCNTATPLGYIDQNASIINGNNNTTSGAFSFIAGGSCNSITSNGNYASILGSYASINHEGAIILTDSVNRAKTSSSENSLTLDFASGVYFAQPSIRGNVNFISRPTVNGTGILLIGEVPGSSITIKNQGSSEGSASTLDFVGAGVSASVNGSIATIAINGGTGNGISLVSPPNSPSSVGISGSIALDSNYVYFCIATNTWTRTALASW